MKKTQPHKSDEHRTTPLGIEIAIVVAILVVIISIVISIFLIRKNILDGHPWPIHDAVKLNQVDWVSSILEEDWQMVNVKDDLGKTPLLLAVTSYSDVSPKIVKLLLEHGADINSKDQYGNSVLGAVAGSDVEKVKLVLDYAGDDVINVPVNSDGNTMLHMACQANKKEIILLLLAHGADRTIRNRVSKMPLDYVSRDSEGSDEIIQILKQNQRLRE